MALFKKKWEHNDPQKRIKGIQKLEDQEILKKIAGQDSALEVRLAAIEKITDDLFLAQLCNFFGACEISRAALKRIKLDEVLVSLALVTTDPILARDAVAKLSQNIKDEKTFQMLALQAKTPMAMEKALAMVENPSFLAETALTHPVERVALAGVKKVTDNSQLENIAFKAKSASTRQEAAKQITDEKILRTLVFNHSDSDIKKIAASKMNDKETLRTMIMDEKYKDLFLTAAQQYLSLKKGPPHQDVLLKIALSGTRYSRDAASLLTRQEDMKQVFCEISESLIRRDMLEKITDEQFLLKVAQDTENTNLMEFKSAYQSLSFGDEETADLLFKLFSSAKPYSHSRLDERKKIAYRLKELLLSNPPAAAFIWPRVIEYTSTKHEDVSQHDDNGAPLSRNSDCTHTDYIKHTDQGVGLQFPAYLGEE